MGNTPGTSTPPVPIGNTSTLILSGVSLVLLGGFGFGAYWAMTELPAQFVNESSYMTGPANARVPDQDAIENAYNQARVPIGVTAAALLAATAAAAGVVMNNRTVSLGAATLRQANEKDGKDRTQWSEEQFSKRYQDAATQLGSTSAAVRFAGVYAMVRLAEEWEAHRQVCIDVLCAYLRMPFPTEQKTITENSSSRARSVVARAVAGVRGRNETPVHDDEHESPAWLAEWEVRRAILQQIELHCRPEYGEKGGEWSALRYDLSWSTLGTFTMRNAVFQDLSMYGVKTVKNSAINLHNVRLDGAINVRQMHVQGGLGFATTGTADLQFSGLTVDGGHLNIKHDTKRAHCVTLNGVTLKNSAKMTLYVSARAVSNSITGREVKIGSGSELILYGEQLFNQAQHAIWLRAVYAEEGAKISPHHRVFGQRLAAFEWAPDSPVKTTGEARIVVTIDTVNPADHILKTPGKNS